MRTDLALKKQQIMNEMYNGFKHFREKKAAKYAAVQYKKTLHSFCKAAKPSKAEIVALGISSKEEFFVLTYGMSPEAIAALKTNPAGVQSQTQSIVQTQPAAATAGKHCTNCGTAAQAEQKFCGNCGTAFSA
jgi:hypothetical protein